MSMPFYNRAVTDFQQSKSIKSSPGRIQGAIFIAFTVIKTIDAQMKNPPV